MYLLLNERTHLNKILYFLIFVLKMQGSFWCLVTFPVKLKLMFFLLKPNFSWNSQSCNESVLWKDTETLLSALRQGRWDSLQQSKGEPTQWHVFIESDISRFAESGCWGKNFLCGGSKLSELIPCKTWENTNLAAFGKGCCKTPQCINLNFRTFMITSLDCQILQEELLL